MYYYFNTEHVVKKLINPFLCTLKNVDVDFIYTFLIDLTFMHMILTISLTPTWYGLKTPGVYINIIMLDLILKIT